jgi:hypothetical protein
MSFTSFPIPSAELSSVAVEARAAIKAVSSDVLFFDDFSRYANNYQVGSNITTPIVGTTYLQSIDGTTPAPGSMFIENGGLRCPVNSNNYLGFSIPNNNGELDVCVEIENRNPSGFFNASVTGFTLAFKEAAAVTPPGIDPTSTMHLNINSQGVTDANQYLGQASTYLGTGDPTTAWGGVKGPNAIWRVRVKAKGNLLEISAFGRTLRWTNSAMPARLAGDRIHLYFQLNNVTFAGLPAPAERTYPVLRRIWINAPENSLNAAFPGSGGHALEGNPSATYPNFLTVAPGDRPASGHSPNLWINENPALRVFGTASVGADNRYTGQAAYVEGFLNLTPPTGGINPFRPVISPRTLLTAKVATAANAVLTNIRSLQKQINLQQGMVEYQRLAGTFGANTNSKQIQVRETGSTIFDSGTTTQNGGVWTLEVTRQSITGTTEVFMFEYWSQATGILKSVSEFNRGTTFTSFNLHASGVAAGDVTIFHHMLMCSQ